MTTTEISEYVTGTCYQMCPKHEIKVRQREGLVHQLEAIPGTENKRNLIADQSRMVKSFSRSAAGVNMTVASNLRPPEILRQTVSYLLHDIITVNYLPASVVYDFILDRLRAVRQDMVIQNLSVADSISILQPIVKFHTYAAYKFCECSKKEFDPVINKKHLIECLKRLLVLYDECDGLHFKYIKQSSNRELKLNFRSYEELFVEERPYFEALYLITNLGETEALVRILNLPDRWRLQSVVQHTLKISLSYCKANWIRTCRLISDLPPLLAGIAALELPHIRRKCFEQMSVAYSSRNLGFPADCLKELLLYSRICDLTADCHICGIDYNGETSLIYFRKGTYKSASELRPRHELFIEEKLTPCSVPLLMLGNFG